MGLWLGVGLGLGLVVRLGLGLGVGFGLRVRVVALGSMFTFCIKNNTYLFFRSCVLYSGIPELFINNLICILSSVYVPSCQSLHSLPHDVSPMSVMSMVHELWCNNVWYLIYILWSRYNCYLNVSLGLISNLASILL